MLILALAACAPGIDANSKTSEDDEGFSDEWGSSSGQDDENDKNGDENGDKTVPDAGPGSMEEGECPLPTECVQLAEGVDRGDVDIKINGMGAMVIDNRAEYSVCLDGWYTFTGVGTQDAIGGVSSLKELAPGRTASLWYGRWQSDPVTWWCIEEDQYTKANSAYTFNGSDAPDLAESYALDSHDVNQNGVEDHDEGDEYGMQSQHDIWNYLDESPVIIVGRSINYMQMERDETASVVVEVRNLGRVAGTARITETVGSGAAAMGWSVEPLSSTLDENTGATTYVFDVAVPAAIDPEDGGTTTYGKADIVYQLQYVGRCSGREVGSAPQAYWADGYGDSYVSAGADMVIECCSGDDEPVKD